MKTYNKFIKIEENSKDHSFNIGDRVICKKGRQDQFDVNGWNGTIIGMNLTGGVGELNRIMKRGTMYQVDFKNCRIAKISRYWIFEELLIPYDEDEDEYRKYKEKMELIRLKHMEYDPYGEENWDD